VNTGHRRPPRRPRGQAGLLAQLPRRVRRAVRSAEQIPPGDFLLLGAQLRQAARTGQARQTQMAASRSSRFSLDHQCGLGDVAQRPALRSGWRGVRA